MAEETEKKEVFASPPAAMRPAQEDGNSARARLHQLACELIRTQNRRLLMEYLQLRRAVR